VKESETCKGCTGVQVARVTQDYCVEDKVRASRALYTYASMKMDSGAESLKNGFMCRKYTKVSGNDSEEKKTTEALA
jgi:hypothetical protein